MPQQNSFDPQQYLKKKKSFDPQAYLRGKGSQSFDPTAYLSKLNEKPLDPIDSIYNVIKRLESGDRASRHNNPGAVMITNELIEKFNARPGDHFPDNPNFKTAYFNTPEEGEAGTKHIIKSIYETSEGDLTKFASIYTLGKLKPETTEEAKIVNRYVTLIQNENSALNIARTIAKDNQSRQEENKVRTDTILSSDDPIKELNVIKSTEKKIEEESPEVQKAVKDQLYSRARQIREGLERPNYDEGGERVGESSHKMRAEFIEGRWVAFPTLFPLDEKGEKWEEYSKDEEVEVAYQKAKDRDELFEFGQDKDSAIEFSLGSWKPREEGAKNYFLQEDPEFPLADPYRKETGGALYQRPEDFEGVSDEDMDMLYEMEKIRPKLEKAYTKVLAEIQAVKRLDDKDDPLTKEDRERAHKIAIKELVDKGIIKSKTANLFETFITAAVPLGTKKFKDDPRTAAELQIQATPAELFITEGAGALAGLIGVGKLTGSGNVFRKTSESILQRGGGIKIGKTAKEGVKIGLSTEKLGGRAFTAGRTAQVATTFGTFEALNVIGENISPEEKAKAIIKNATIGAGLGLTGSISSPFRRIPSEGLFGFAVGMVETGDPKQATVNALVFSAFGLLNRRDLEPVKRRLLYEQFAENYLKLYRPQLYDLKGDARKTARKELIKILKDYKRQIPYKTTKMIEKDIIDFNKRAFKTASKINKEVRKTMEASKRRTETAQIIAKQRKAAVEVPVDKIKKMTAEEHIGELKSLGYKIDDIVVMNRATRESIIQNNILPGEPPMVKEPKDIAVPKDKDVPVKTKALIKTKPIDLDKVWGEKQQVVEDLRSELNPRADEISEELSKLKGGKKDVVLKRKTLKQELKEIEEKIYDAEGIAEKEYREHLSKVEAEVKKRFKEVYGITDPSVIEEGVSTVLTDALERPGIEWSWEMPISKIADKYFDMLVRENIVTKEGEKVKEELPVTGEPLAKSLEEKFEYETEPVSYDKETGEALDKDGYVIERKISEEKGKKDLDNVKEALKIGDIITTSYSTLEKRVESIDINGDNSISVVTSDVDAKRTKSGDLPKNFQYGFINNVEVQGGRIVTGFDPTSDVIDEVFVKGEDKVEPYTEAQTTEQAKYSFSDKKKDLKGGVSVDAEGLGTIKTHPKYVTIDESKFQPREEYNQAIIDDIAENFDPAKWDEPIVWEDPKTDEYYIVSGHHRHLGVLKGGFSAATYKVLPKGTSLEEAINMSEEGNLARTEQTDFENAGVVRRRVNRGDTLKKVQEDLPGLTKGKVTKLLKLSYLDPGGEFKSNYYNINEFPRIVSMSEYVGGLRKKYDWMSNTHENDIFRYLYVENGVSGDTDKFQLNLNTSLEQVNSMDEKPERLIQQLRKDVLEVPESAHDELKAEIADIDSHIDTITRQLNDNISLKQLVDARVKSKGESETEALKEVKKELHKARRVAMKEKLDLIEKTTKGSPDQEGLFESDYRGVHRPASREEGHKNSGDDPTDIYPEDVYGENGARYYGDGIANDNVTIAIMRSMRGNPDKVVKIYRAVPKDVEEINPGDWVTINKEYAKYHGYRHIGDDYKIIAKEVKASEIFTGGESIHEWGYDPEISEWETNFKKWFKESKVIDDNGDPLVVYHGTDKNFTRFSLDPKDTDPMGTGEAWGVEPFGFHFGSPEAANSRIRDMATTVWGSGEVTQNLDNMQIYPVYISIQNPIRLPDLGRWDDPYQVGMALEKHHPKEFKGLEEKLLEEELKDDDWDLGARQRSLVLGEIKSKGYDGVVYSNQYEGVAIEDRPKFGRAKEDLSITGNDSYIAFEPTQIKSIYNKGAFNPKDPQILAEPQTDIFGGEKEVFNLRDIHQLEQDEILLEIHQIKNERKYLEDQKNSEVISAIDYNKYLKDLQKRRADVNKRQEKLDDLIAKDHSKQQGLFEKVRAFHGSPHTFDQFKLEAIGTGEGVQAYGWGLYFTDSKEIGNHYAKLGKESANLVVKEWTLNGINIISPENNKYDDQPVPIDYNPHILEKKLNISYEDAVTTGVIIENLILNEWEYKRELVDSGDMDKVRSMIEERLQQSIDNKRDQIKELSKGDTSKADLGDYIYDTGADLYWYISKADETVDDRYIKGHLRAIQVIQKFIDDLPNLKLTMDSVPTANLYEVEINSPEKLNWMEWDVPLTFEQRDAIWEGINKHKSDLKPKVSREKIHRQVARVYDKEGWDLKEWEDALGLSEEYPDLDITGRQVYELLTYEMPVERSEMEKAASMWLKKIGIDGVKFKAIGGTGGKKGDLHNYVVFDESQVKIVNSKMFEPSAKYEDLKNERQVAFGTETEANREITIAGNIAQRFSEGATRVYRAEPSQSSPSQTLKETGHLEIKGQTIASSKDAAELLSIFRNPRVEILHSVLVGADKKVLAHNAVSSGSGYYVDAQDKNMASIVLRAKRVGAKKLYFAHNHPSGDPTPSKGDMDAVQRLQKIKDKLYPELEISSIVIDHTEFAEITQGVELISYKKTPYSAKRLHNRISVRSNQDIVNTFHNAVGTDLAKAEKLNIMILDPQYRVIAMEFANKQEDLSFLSQFIIDKTREHKGRFVIVAGKKLNLDETEYVPNMVQDVLSIEDDGVVSLMDIGKLKQTSHYYKGGSGKLIPKIYRVDKGIDPSKALFESAKTPRKKALARAHILENELGLSIGEKITLKKAITGFKSLGKADDQSIKAYINHLVKMKTGKDPIPPPKRYDKSILDLEKDRENTDINQESRIKKFFLDRGETIEMMNTYVIKSMDRALNKDFGEGGKELRKLLREAELDVDVWVKPQEAKFEELIAKIPSSDLPVLKQIIESGGVEGMSDATKTFVEWWNGMTNDIYAKGKKYINPKLKYVDNYFPLVLQEDFYNTMSPKHKMWDEVVEHVRVVLEERMATGQQTIYKEVTTEQAEAYVVEFLEHYKSKGTRTHFLQQVFDPPGEYRHSYPIEMHRDRVFPEWAYENDVGNVIHSYIDKSYTSIAYAKHLEKVDEEYNYQKVQELTDQIRIEGYDHRLAGDMVAWVMKLKTLERTKERFVRGAKTLTSFLLSVKTTVKNVGDIQKGIAWTNLNSMFKSILMSYFSRNRGHAQLGKDIIGSRHVFTQSLQRVGLGGAFLSRWYTRIIGFQGSERFVRKQNGLASIIYARSLLRRWNPESNTRRQRYITRTLKRLTQYDLPTLKKIKAKGNFNREEELRIGDIGINETQPTSTLDRPIGWEASAFVSTATIFRSFGHKGLRFIKDYIFKEITNHGNFNPMIRFILSRLALGYTLEEVTNWLYAVSPEEEEEFAEKLLEVMKSTGELGLIPDIVFAVEHSGWASPTISLLFGAFFSSVYAFTRASFIGLSRLKEGEADPGRELRKEISSRTLKKIPVVGKTAHEEFVGDPPRRRRKRKATR